MESQYDSETVICFECCDSKTVSIYRKLTSGIKLLDEISEMIEDEGSTFTVPLPSHSSLLVEIYFNLIKEQSYHTETLTELKHQSLKTEPSPPDWLRSKLSSFDIFTQCQILDLSSYLQHPLMESMIAWIIGDYIRNLPDDVFHDSFNTTAPIGDAITRATLEESWAFPQTSVNTSAATTAATTTVSHLRDEKPIPGKKIDIHLTKGLLHLSATDFRRVIGFI